jgi:signal transduction histidine kinase
MSDRATAPRMALRAAPTPPAEIMDAAAARFRIRHPERPLVVELGEGLPRIDADATLLRRVVDNLLENAHKYTPDVSAPIRLTATSVGGQLELAVIDRGVGIAADDLPRIYTAFFRGERSRSRATGGVGLGLTLARRIVDAHRGRIDVDSAPGQGTTMRVTLPPTAA